MQRRSRETRDPVGFALDPDGDRLVVVDETGSFPGEEYTLALAASFCIYSLAMADFAGG